MRLLVWLIFFASGFAALLYQVIWQRTLALYSGADVYSITIIVAAFMAGLGCGSLAGGHLADRLGPRGRVIAFAGAELAIAGFALVSLWLYHDVLYTRFQGVAGSSVGLPLVLFASLLFPTFFMGLSLPLLARSTTRRVAGASTSVGLLYAVNTLGAAAGAFACTWIFMRTLGFEGAVRVGAALNILAALASLALLESAPRTGTFAGAGAPTVPDGRGLEEVRWPMIYALSGFIALSLEIIWFRLIGVVIKPTAFSFGNLLGIFLAGLAAGTFIGIRWARRSDRPVAVFLGLQAAVPLLAGLSVAILCAIIMADLAPALRVHLAQYDPVDVDAALSSLADVIRGSQPASRESLGLFVRVYVIVPLLMIGPPTLLMGISFPFLQRIVQTDISYLGRRVGWLQTANIVGSMLGAIVTGWIMLDLVGTVWTLRVLVGFGGVFALMLARHVRLRHSLVAAVVATALAVVALLPAPRALWAALHGVEAAEVIFAEDGSGVSLLRVAGDTTTVYSNGLGQSEIPFPPWHISLGLIPAMIHHDPQSIAVIGLGSGATLFAAGGRRETRRITLIEIVEAQRATLMEMDRSRPDQAIRSLLRDSRISYHFTDARRFLQTGSGKYDIIEADALRPASAYSGNLYSEEYFALVKSRLNHGGLAVTWAPTERVVRTFVKVFPHALLYTDTNIRMLLGSGAPIPWNPTEIARRLNDDFARRHYRAGGIDVTGHAASVANARIQRFGPDVDRSLIQDTNRDLFPKDEFLVR